jgi:hypothetical protein
VRLRSRLRISIGARVTERGHVPGHFSRGALQLVENVDMSRPDPR